MVRSDKGMVRWLIILVWLGLLVGCSNKRAAERLPPLTSKPQASEMRGVWWTTLYGLDWPGPSTLDAPNDADRIRQQQNALTAKLDNLVKIGVNTVFFQVKPDGNALYRSELLPWSEVLTGTVGRDPGYDPLAFMLAQAHKRGLKVHAWLNPYRVTLNTRPETAAALNATLRTSPASVYALHPDWIRIASGRYVLDPGLPEVRNWVVSVVTELVKNYPVDGVQFDDYFYYETPDSRVDDDATYRLYGQDFSDKADWRRHNTLLMIQQVSQAVKSLNAHVAFGISPAGVWRNAADDPRGSATQAGGPAYDTAYADTRQWVRLGLLDYIAPQLYWPVARQIVRYDVLANWWSEVVRPTHTKLYIGVALYKIGSPTKVEPDWGVEGGVAELKKQLDINDALPEVNGTILFSEAYLSRPQTAAAVDYLQSRWRP
ncbi:glycoside hydrolase family 10 protein [Sodalis endosymbiont of Spalangia cameroni]